MFPAIMAILFVLIGSRFLSQMVMMFILTGKINDIRGYPAYAIWIACMFILATPFAAIEYARA